MKLKIYKRLEEFTRRWEICFDPLCNPRRRFQLFNLAVADRLVGVVQSQKELFVAATRVRRSCRRGGTPETGGSDGV
jgi:hypothetical protein